VSGLRIGKRKAAAAVLGLVTVIAAFGAWYFAGTDALLAVVVVAVIVGAVVVVNTVVQSERRLRSDFSSALRRVKDDFGSLLDDFGSALDIDLDRKLQRPAEQADALLRAVNAAYTRLELEQQRALKPLGRINANMARYHKHQPAELDALLQVHRRLNLNDPQPLMGGWALSPRGMLQVIDLIERQDSSFVVECGSGTSTIFMARALQLKGSGRLIALEHLVEYQQQANDALKLHGLSDFAEVRLAPLEPLDLDGGQRMWYGLSSIEDLSAIDLLLVDGPPGTIGPAARYPAYPILRGRLAPSAVILLDDVQRTDERSIVDAWLQAGGLVESSAYSAEQVILHFVGGGEAGVS
jgi:predicted O-methyltransferase YrrM